MWLSMPSNFVSTTSLLLTQIALAYWGRHVTKIYVVCLARTI